MITKKSETECLAAFQLNSNDFPPFVNEEFVNEEFVDLEADKDLEKFEDDFSQNFEDIEVDMSFLTQINKTVVENLESKPKKDRNEGDHPVDAYLRGLILDVLVKDFLPILQKHLLVTQIIKKEDK